MADPTTSRTARASGSDAPAAAAGNRAGLGRFLTPQWVLPVLGAVLVVTVLFTPATDRTGDSRLTTRSTEPQGARALYELAGRLGWRPERRDVGLSAAQTRLAAGGGGAADAVAALDTTATYAVLDPPTDLTATEASTLLDAVRRGAGLLAVLRRGATLGDSLHVQPSMGGAPQADAATDPGAGDCPRRRTSEGLINWGGGRVHSYWLVPRAKLPADTVSFAWVALSRTQVSQRRRAAIARTAAARKKAARESTFRDSVERARAPHAAPASLGDSARLDTLPAAAARRDTSTRTVTDDDDEDEPDSAERAAAAIEDSITLARLDSVEREPAALGFPLGRGRVVVVADPDWLRNDVIRVCSWNAGVTAVRMLEYLGQGRPGGTRRLVFDEFHQGFGRHPSTLAVIGRALSQNAPGRALTQALAAALLLLAAVGARALPPRSRARLERRSPLEHVGALSRAYAQVGATRLATRRLVRGVRRRHGSGAAARFVRAAAPTEGDDEFLSAVAARYPSVAADAQLVREALRSPRSAAEFLDVGRALERIEDAVAGRDGGGGTTRPPAVATPPEPAPTR